MSGMPQITETGTGLGSMWTKRISEPPQVDSSSSLWWLLSLTSTLCNPHRVFPPPGTRLMIGDGGVNEVPRVSYEIGKSFYLFLPLERSTEEMSAGENFSKSTGDGMLLDFFILIFNPPLDFCLLLFYQFSAIDGVAVWDRHFDVHQRRQKASWP